MITGSNLAQCSNLAALRFDEYVTIVAHGILPSPEMRLSIEPDAFDGHPYMGSLTFSVVLSCDGVFPLYYENTRSTVARSFFCGDLDLQWVKVFTADRTWRLPVFVQGPMVTLESLEEQDPELHTMYETELFGGVTDLLSIPWHEAQGDCDA